MDKIVENIGYINLVVIVNNKIHEYIDKNNSYPRYIKIPLWIFEELKSKMYEIDIKMDYKSNCFYFMNLKICETASIEKIEDIEVF